ncbi:MAG: hypothetical protein Q9166_007692 [cf. Caloplaca sp. 2 TL-2023]
MDSPRSFGEISSLGDDLYTKSFGPSATSTRTSSQYTNYGFLAVLGLAQRLHIRFLPITWQAALGRIGRGGQARINQALANLQTSFAFKRFDHPDRDPFRETVQEMVVLTHPRIQEHEHIVRLEGICWDIPQDDKIWPVLVFQMSHLGDLYNFTRLEKFKTLSMEDRFNICADIGIAIRDMHHNANQVAGIVHGDIKPQNVLIFEEKSRIVAKVADFGFATCFQSEDNLVSIPVSVPWNAPERHNGYFQPKQAKQMDCFSFGILCFWLLFASGPLGNLPLPPDTVSESGQLVTFEPYEPEKNLLHMWKKDNRLVEWVCCLVREDGHLANSAIDRLVSLFQITLALDPKSRCIDFERIIYLLTPDR